MTTETNKDKHRQSFTDALAAAFRQSYPSLYEELGDTELFSAATLYDSVEKPKDARMGRYAVPVFKYLRLLKQKPHEVTQSIARAANDLLERNHHGLIRVVAAGGYLNAEIDATGLAAETLSTVLAMGAQFGSSRTGQGQTQLVEYSSPNIAKPFGIGHLRTTVIGNSLRRIFKKLGYRVIGINYPGDWGTQFGKMIVAWQLWGGDHLLDGANDVKRLLELYVRFHEEAEKDSSLDDRARAAFKALESGQPEAVALWEKFKEISFAEFNRVYGNLGIEFDLVIGESFFNDKMDAVIARLERAGLTRESQGALIVELGDTNLPPALLKKSDGATLYITRDLAGAIYRWETYRFHESLYVVGAAQADHFRQMLKVLELLEEAEHTPETDRMSGRIRHVEFGWVRFGGSTMSTRRGQIVFLDDVIAEAVALARARIREKNPDLAEIDATAHMIGTGAVIFGQLSGRRHKDIDFEWEVVLNFEGETGPYLQYTHARLCSLIRKYGLEIRAAVDYAVLESEEEQRVIELLADFPDIVADAARTYEPFIVSSYLLRLASAYNKVYQRKDEDNRMVKIISEDDAATAARMALVKAVQTVLKEGLALLGLQAPEEM